MALCRFFQDRDIFLPDGTTFVSIEDVMNVLPTTQHLVEVMVFVNRFQYECNTFGWLDKENFIHELRQELKNETKQIEMLVGTELIF